MELMEPFTTMKDIIGSREHDPNLTSWFNIITSRALAVLDEHSNTIMAEKIKKIMKSPFFELFKDCVNGKLTENSVICHGDCWNNNIMYKYKVRNVNARHPSATKQIFHPLKKTISPSNISIFFDMAYYFIIFKRYEKIYN